MTGYVDTRIPRGYLVVSPRYLRGLEALYYAGGRNDHGGQVDSVAFAADYQRHCARGSGVTLHQLYEHHLARDFNDGLLGDEARRQGVGAS